jgi:hypothetical protein
MALSPQYFWPEPDNSSLVKNGAQDIRALGDAIDTSVWNVGYGQAGKNKLINGDFTINQRQFTSVTTEEYNFDRWRTRFTGGTSTTTLETFTLGAAPVAGYEGKNFYRVAITGQAAVTDFVRVEQLIESVRTFAGQTATFSFWAKAATGTPEIAIIGVQAFASGSGGSSAVTTEYGTVTISTSWARYSVVCAIPSISGKTIGTLPDDFLSPRLVLSAGTSVTGNQGIGYQNNTFDIWGLQLEAGSVATAFQTATGTIQGELAACQRYYYRITPSAIGNRLASAACDSTTLSESVIQFPVTLRTAPTALEQSGTAADYTLRVAGSTITCSSVPTFLNATPFTVGTNFAVAAGLVAGQAANIRAAATTAFLGWSAEL